MYGHTNQKMPVLSCKMIFTPKVVIFYVNFVEKGILYNRFTKLEMNMNLTSTSKLCSAWFLIAVLLIQIIMPYQAHALTGGPSQPEVESFSPAGVSEMVDPATGSFSYNIPLLDVGGFPVNLSYQSDITMDQEASVVGLGWNISPGVINRNMRGLPDDFNGDEVTKDFNMKPNTTWGVSGGFNTELFGLSFLSMTATMGLNHNSYNGYGVEIGIAPSLSAGDKDKGMGTLGLGLTASTSGGVGFSPSLSFSKKVGTVDNFDTNLGVNVSTSINSRQGLKAMTMGTSMSLSYMTAYRYKPTASAVDAGTSANFSFGSPTYVPSIQFPMKNHSFSFSGRLGLELFGVQGGVQLSGYYSNQKLATNQIKSRAFGLMYARKAKNELNAIQDFNRENDGPFSGDYTRHLPLAALTADVFSVSGQGLSGSYQLRTGDVGARFDNQSTNLSSGESLGAEIGAGNLVRGGGDVMFNSSNSYSKKWHDLGSNGALNSLDFAGDIDNSDPDYEPVYFKMAGERTVDEDPDFWNDLGGWDAVRPQLADAGGLNVRSNSVLVDQNDNVVRNLGGTIKRKKRERRNQLISFLTADQASVYGLNRCINNYTENNFSSNNVTPEPRVDGIKRKGHHISEISVLREGGQKYIFGTPAYNNVQKEVSFSVDGSTADCQNGLIPYSAQDVSVNNNKGKENYFNQVTTPAYAHSFLLTAIVSPDYVDRTGNGCSPDDFGTYTQINYTKTNDAYPWRTPFEPGKANYNQGFRADPSDDKANFVEGDRENFLIHSIVTRTHRAEFYYDNSSRLDGKSATGNFRARKLEKIVLYALNDRLSNASAVPLKTVYFEYGQDLCPGIPNSFVTGAGKLTLKKVWFEYGTSRKGKESAYEFTYSSINPPYNYKNSDRWGAYKLNPTGISCFSHTAPQSNDEFPYSIQDKTQADLNASVWRLTKIKLPSKGEISVFYESGDYAYVQNKSAMRMFKIHNVLPSPLPTVVSSTTADLYNGSSPNLYLYFKLDAPIPSSNANPEQIIKDQYLGSLTTGEYMYYKCMVNLAKPSQNDHWEYVPGYSLIEDYGAANDGSTTDYNLGYIKLKATGTRDKDKIPGDANPIAKAGWQEGRLHQPEVVFGTPTMTQTDAEQVLTAIWSLKGQFQQFFAGFNPVMRAEGFAKQIYNPKSSIRLMDPDKTKLGGGSRVKRIEINDHWGSMAGAPHSSQFYGQDYEYKTVENGDIISSGVAAYEPSVGGDENPWKQPIFSDETVLCAPDNHSYIDEPLGVSFFPTPSIIYSKVLVKNLPQPNVQRYATGWTVNEFYTAKDFPIQTRNTGLKTNPKKSNPVLGFLKLKSKDYMTASEGFVIEQNDMHGKPKATKVYDENQTLISGIEYKYKQSGPGILDNNATVLGKDGTTFTARIGVDLSMIADARESGSSVESGGVQVNVDNFIIPFVPPVPAIVPTPYPSYQEEETQFNSITLTKVINRFGLLEETIAFDLGSTVATKNICYDEKTGEVLLTETTNSFSDPIFQFIFPAHWAYGGMDQACENVGATYTGKSCVFGTCSLGSNPNVCYPGDELSVLNGSGYQEKVWVKDVYSTGIYLIDKNGNPVTFPASTISIIRSGHRNQQTTPIGTITSLVNPLASGNIQFANLKVLEAKTQEMSENWQTFCKDTCECRPNQETIDCYLTTINAISANGLLFANYNNAVPLAPYYSQSGCPPFPLVGGPSPLASLNCPQTAQTYWANYNPSTYTLTTTFGITQACPKCNVTLQFPQQLSPELVQNGYVQFSNLIPDTNEKCEESGLFTVNMTYVSENGTLTYTLSGNSQCLDFVDCDEGDDPDLFYCGNIAGKVVNPYFEGIRGNWRPQKEYVRLTKRVQQGVALSGGYNTQTQLRYDGWYQSFTSFWKKVSSTWIPNPSGWTWSQQATIINPLGNSLESVDALGLYSAETMGYWNSFVTAASGNARYEDIFFLGFEDVEYGDSFFQYLYDDPCSSQQPTTDLCRPLPHFGFNNISSASLSQTAHTGKFSLSLNPGQSPLIKKIRLKDCSTGPNPALAPYTLQSCDCVGKFNPTPGKKYVFSAWVSEDLPPTALNFTTHKVDIVIDGTVNSFQASGDIIEGWQRIFGEFNVPAGTQQLEIKLTAGNTQTLFDELRVHPFDARFKSFVYNPVNLRFTHELDDNNYFMENEYDNRAQLERVKKETEKGIMIVKEFRFSNAKQ